MKVNLTKLAFILLMACAHNSYASNSFLELQNYLKTKGWNLYDFTESVLNGSKVKFVKFINTHDVATSIKQVAAKYKYKFQQFQAADGVQILSGIWDGRHWLIAFDTSSDKNNSSGILSSLNTNLGHLVKPGDSVEASYIRLFPAGLVHINLTNLDQHKVIDIYQSNVSIRDMFDFIKAKADGFGWQIISVGTPGKVNKNSDNYSFHMELANRNEIAIEVYVVGIRNKSLLAIRSTKKGVL